MSLLLFSLLLFWYVSRNAVDLMANGQQQQKNKDPDQLRLNTLAQMMAKDNQPQLTLDYLQQQDKQEKEQALER
jgi:hypothetical protein